MPADPRPTKRHKASAAEWKLIRRIKGADSCRICGSDTFGELHHIVPKSQRGDDTADNLVALCSLCHGLIEARDDTASLRLGLKLREAERAYVRRRKGDWYLVSRYRVAVEESAREKEAA